MIRPEGMVFEEDCEKISEQERVERITITMKLKEWTKQQQQKRKKK